MQHLTGYSSQLKIFCIYIQNKRHEADKKMNLSKTAAVQKRSYFLCLKSASAKNQHARDRVRLGSTLRRDS